MTYSATIRRSAISGAVVYSASPSSSSSVTKAGKPMKL
jgi:hypothetical protein